MIYLKKTIWLPRKSFNWTYYIQLTDQVYSSFKRNQFTLGIFIDLSKASDTVDHKILISELKNYGVTGNNLKWFKSCLNNRKQFIAYNNKYTSFETITYRVSQGVILEPLLFLIYVNDLNQELNKLDPIMFADDTNLFYSHHLIKMILKQ